MSAKDFKESQLQKAAYAQDRQYQAADSGNYGPQYIPAAMPTAGGAPAGSSVSNQVKVDIHAAPGMSPEAIGQVVVAKFAEHGVVTGDHLEAAAAAAGQ